IKPSTIMLRWKGESAAGVKLLHVGIAKLLDVAVDLASTTGRMMGTPAYMAPEQAVDAKRVDTRADVYSFAATLFTALTGRRLFEASSLPELIFRVQSAPTPPLSPLLSGVPAQLDEAMARCLAKRPEERPASITEAWSSLRDGLRQVGTVQAARRRPPPVAVSPPLTAVSARPAPSLSLSTTAAPAAPPRRRPVIGLAFAAAIAIGGAVAWVWTSDAH